MLISLEADQGKRCVQELPHKGNPAHSSVVLVKYLVAKNQNGQAHLFPCNVRPRSFCQAVSRPPGPPSPDQRPAEGAKAVSQPTWPADQERGTRDKGLNKFSKMSRLCSPLCTEKMPDGEHQDQDQHSEITDSKILLTAEVH